VSRARRALALLAAVALACSGAREERRPAAAPADAAPAATSPPDAKAQAAPAAQAPAASAGPDRSRIPPRGPPPALDVPPQKRFTLSSGLRVRLVEYRRLPIVALHLVLDAGGVHDPPAQPGVASFTAAMLTEGTKRRSAIQISDDVGSLGASLSAGAAFDSASLSGSSLSRHLDALLDVYADVLLHPTFPEKDFRRVKDQRLVALVQQRDQPGAVAAKAFAELYWGNHPYGHWLLGDERSLRATTREDLARFHRRWWKPSRAELVVVGDVSQAELAAKLERALGAWRGEAPPPVRARGEPAGEGRTVLIEKRGAPQAFLMLGMPGLERASDDYVATEVAYQILGGGMASRLFRNLREKEGYTYGVYARGEARKLGGTSFVVGSVKAEVTGKAMAALLDELRRMRAEPATEAELETARNSLVLSLPSQFSTAAGIAAKLAEEAIFGLPDDYWNRYATEVAAVTAADVQRVSAKFLDPARLTAVMVAEPATVKPQLAGLPIGAVEVRPPPGAERAAPKKVAPAAKAQPRAQR
jgi:predicted Zn-dependent peptidase